MARIEPATADTPLKRFSAYESSRPLLRVAMLEFQPKPRPRRRNRDHPIFRIWRPLEQHVFDADVIVEPFEMAEARGGAGGMQVQRGSAMAGQIDVMRVGERGDSKEARDPAAACYVGLDNVYRAGFEHVPVIIDLIAVLAGGDIHAGRRALPQEPKAFEIVGRD